MNHHVMCLEEAIGLQRSGKVLNSYACASVSQVIGRMVMQKITELVAFSSHDDMVYKANVWCEMEDST